MSWEPILILLLIRHLRITLRRFSPSPVWNKQLKWAMYAVGIGMALEIAFRVEAVTTWVWYLLLFTIIIVTLARKELYQARSVIFAILPFTVLSAVDELLEGANQQLYKQIDNYIGYAIVIAITWMISMLIISQRQQKAMLEEQKRRQEEEEHARQMALRKTELEVMVAERTAELKQQKEELQHALEELKTTQAQLIQSEKMASLGELTAGIAHEIQNPLNFVNNFSEVSVELLAELKQEHLSALPDEDKIKTTEIIEDLVHNLEKIAHHGKRADGIVKGMLQHSRSNIGQKEPTDVNALVDEYLRLSYHGLRAKDKSFNAIMEARLDEDLPKINIIPQDIGRVILNLFTNAFYSVTEKSKQQMEGYKPTVSVSTKLLRDREDGMAVEVCVRDNGMGIPQKVIDKIFQPFFSTKPTGQGTGLGLSISYDIITQQHGGQMRVETKEGEFAEFVILLPE